MQPKILIIYTGGTIGMLRSDAEPYLIPYNFLNIGRYVPEVNDLNCQIEYITLKKAIDSSNMTPQIWEEIAITIQINYKKYDGFVILHGTDTMSYTASALSFMLENLNKPVILTGSQLPIDVIRSDARENLVTAIEIAAHTTFKAPEVAIFFGTTLLRGNRARKHQSERFDAFLSANYPPLVEAGSDLVFFKNNWLPNTNQPFTVHTKFNQNIGLIKFFPGISRKFIEAVLLQSELDAIILETYGTGNLPDFPWFIDALSNQIKNNIIIANITQCLAGKVVQEKYSTGHKLFDIGVLSGRDMTTSAALTKLMYLFGKYSDRTIIKEMFEIPLRGEMS